MYRIVSDMLQVYNITVSFGENIVKFKISDRCLFRGDLFIEKVPEPKLWPGGREREKEKKKKVLSSYILERLCHSRDKNEDLNNKKKKKKNSKTYWPVKSTPFSKYQLVGKTKCQKTNKQKIQTFQKIKAWNNNKNIYHTNTNGSCDDILWMEERLMHVLKGWTRKVQPSFMRRQTPRSLDDSWIYRHACAIPVCTKFQSDGRKNCNQVLRVGRWRRARVLSIQWLKN